MPRTRRAALAQDMARVRGAYETVCLTINDGYEMTADELRAELDAQPEPVTENDVAWITELRNALTYVEVANAL